MRLSAEHPMLNTLTHNDFASTSQGQSFENNRQFMMSKTSHNFMNEKRALPETITSLTAQFTSDPHLS